MMRRMMTACVLGVLMIAPAYAADPPASAEQCQKLHSEIFHVVAKGTIPEGTKAKLDDQFAKLKGLCATAAYVEAGQTIAAIRDTAGLNN